MLVEAFNIIDNAVLIMYIIPREHIISSTRTDKACGLISTGC